MEQEKIWRIIDIINWAQDYLGTKGISSPRLNIELMLADILGCSRIDLYLNFDRPLNKAQLSTLREYVKKRAKHEPIQYVLGYTEFMGYKIKTDSRALIPRPETEILLREAIKILNEKNKADLKILEIGSGSGCISIVLAKQFPSAKIFAVEISKDAIDLANENIKTFNIDNIFLVQSDFLNSEINENEFDLIISNPPYIPYDEFVNLSEDILKYEPHIALTDGSAGLTFYNKFADISHKLNSEGIMLLEIDGRNTKELISIFSGSSSNIEIIKDYAEFDRILKINKSE